MLNGWHSCDELKVRHYLRAILLEDSLADAARVLHVVTCCFVHAHHMWWCQTTLRYVQLEVVHRSEHSRVARALVLRLGLFTVLPV